MGRIERVDDGLWCVAHDVYLPGGVHFPGRMTVVQLPSGALWLHSPVPIDDGLAGELAALGPVAHLVAPNQFHNLFLAQAAERYPEAAVYLAAGLADRVSGLPSGQVLATGDRWEDVIEGRVVDGMPRLSESVFLHRPTATLVVTDLVFHFEPSNWVTAWLLWMVGAKGRMASSRSVWFLTQDAAAARASVEAILVWPFERVIMAHGDIVSDDARARLAEATARLRQGVTGLPGPAPALS